MDFEPLTRPREDYAWAMEQMLHCPDMTAVEFDLCTRLLTASFVSLEYFDEKRREAMMLQPGPLMSLINKCRAAGIGKEWPEHAHQD